MPEHRFPDFSATKFKNQLNADILIALNLIEKATRHPANKIKVHEYRNALCYNNDDSLLPMPLSKKEPRAAKPNKELCVFALLTALIQEWWAYCDNPAEEAIRCYEYIDELKAIADKGIANHTILGDLKKGFYLFRG